MDAYGIVSSFIHHMYGYGQQPIKCIRTEWPTGSIHAYIFFATRLCCISFYGHNFEFQCIQNLFIKIQTMFRNGRSNALRKMHGMSTYVKGQRSGVDEEDLR